MRKTSAIGIMLALVISASSAFADFRSLGLISNITPQQVATFSSVCAYRVVLKTTNGVGLGDQVLSMNLEINGPAIYELNTHIFGFELHQDVNKGYIRSSSTANTNSAQQLTLDFNHFQEATYNPKLPGIHAMVTTWAGDNNIVGAPGSAIQAFVVPGHLIELQNDCGTAPRATPSSSPTSWASPSYSSR